MPCVSIDLCPKKANICKSKSGNSKPAKRETYKTIKYFLDNFYLYFFKFLNHFKIFSNSFTEESLLIVLALLEIQTILPST